jgi:hypothetical protein
VSILIALALAAAPPEIVVLNDAKNICPLASQSEDAAQFVSDYATIKRYTIDQRIEIMSYCLMYSRGFLDGLGGRDVE